MARIVDLSHLLYSGMPVFPGDPPVEFVRASTIKESGYHVTTVRFGTHAGTHVDTPSHVLFDDTAVDSLALDDLVGWAEVLDLGELAPGSEITAAHLDVFSDRVRSESRVILKTGWSRYVGQENYFTAYPSLSEGAAMWLTARCVKLLAVEQPSVHLTEHVKIHKLLLSERLVLVEGLANTAELTHDRVYLVALPLKLQGLDGSPMRVIAIEGADAPEPPPDDSDERNSFCRRV